MNKAQLIDALAGHLGDRRTAASAVDGLLSTIVETVKTGESVSLTSFGVFEARARAARVGRNPRTGQTVAVPSATVPAFRPGTGFKAAVGGTRSAPPPRAARARPGATVAAAEVEAPAEPAKTPAAKTAAAKTRAGKAATGKAATAKAATGKAATGKAAAGKAAGGKAAATNTAAAKAPAAKKDPKKDAKVDTKAVPARKKAKN